MNDSLADTIKPKSDQLNADDLMVAPITVTVLGVKRGPADQPVHIAIDGGHQPYKPCKTMRRVLISAWGDKGSGWVGKSMTLFCDPSVKFGGVALGGIRISHLSHIDNTLSIMLTQSRGKKAMVTIKKLASQFAVDDTAISWITAAKTEDGLAQLNALDDKNYIQFIKQQAGI